jgi:predicted NUDIX family phosphoesterase
LSTNEEHVLVTPRSAFEGLGGFHGFCNQAERYLPTLLAQENLQFLARSLAEGDPSFKQLIPYAVITHGNEILRYFRGSSSGEKRLVAKASIGVGGHINREDQELAAATPQGPGFYRNAVERELREELHLRGSFADRIVGMLNDDSNDVGRVHLGIVHLVEISDSDVHAAESALTGLEFLSIERLREERERLETWSQIVVDHWEDILAL